MNEVALIIIYNHQYNKNIDILEKIYNKRFSNIYHLVPFYNGEKENVISVYDCSFYFQGYVAQGFKSFYKKEYTHYFFIADDLILNPAINENNYADFLNLDENTCFLPGFLNFYDNKCTWGRVIDAFRYSVNIPGVEAKFQLPSYDDALKAFNHIGLEIKPVSFNQIWKKPKSIRDWGRIVLHDKLYVFRKFINTVCNKKYNLSYPLVASYSDIFVVSSDAIKQFCHYCGVFATTKLFVEIGLPTSLVLSAKKISVEKDLNIKGKALWPDGWVSLDGNYKISKNDFKELDKYSCNLKKLLNDFPENYIYIHPIKLSKWDSDI